MNIANRIASLDRRQKPYIIYHELNVSIEFASLNIQIKIDSTTGNDSNIVLLLRNAKMPLLNQCDFIKKVKTISLMDGKQYLLKLRKYICEHTKNKFVSRRVSRLVYSIGECSKSNRKMVFGRSSCFQ